jgi:hypothetical protein
MLSLGPDDKRAMSMSEESKSMLDQASAEAASLLKAQRQGQKPRARSLPPLILHPFSDTNGPSRLVESSRASLMLKGLLPSGELSQDELERRLLDGRYCELRMLFYVGRDLIRWIEQSLDVLAMDATNQDTPATARYNFQSLAAFLVEETPANVVTKLKSWRVDDYKAIFMRAIGLNSLFAEAPERNHLADEFIRHYYRYADHMYFCRQQATVFPRAAAAAFEFELYASGEYTRMLEREWQAGAND